MPFPAQVPQPEYHLRLALLATARVLGTALPQFQAQALGLHPLLFLPGGHIPTRLS